MSQLNNVNNINNEERTSLSNEASNSGNTINSENVNDEFIISLLNNSSDSDSGRDTNTFTESVLNNSGDVDAISVSPFANEPGTPSTNSVLHTNIKLNASKENSDNILNGMKCGQIAMNVDASKEDNELKVEQKKEYRHLDSSWTEDEDSSSTSSSDSEILFESIPRSSSPKVNCVKTKGELDVEDLPPIEYLKISVGEKDLKKVGQVHAVVSKLVVIQAAKDEKPLDIDSVLFLAPDEPLGRIFEVFGPVIEPFYTVLFNTPEDIIEKGVKVGSEVFYAPHKDEITSYVFVDMLRQQKGSDASWKDNNEPPEEHLDYSDDEQERTARLKRKGKGRVREPEDDDEVQIIPYKISPNEKRTFNYTSYARKNSYEMQNSRNSLHNNRNFFQNNRNSIQDNRNSTQNNRSSIQNNWNSIQNNKNSIQNNSSNLDNVPVWISTPPSYLEPKPLPSQTSIANTPPAQSFQLKQPASLQIQNQLQPPNAPNSSQTLFRPGGLLLNPKQPFVPRQPPNLNSQRLLLRPQSPQPPSVNTRYFLPPQRPPHQMQPNMSQPMIFQNMNQHIFGQITPVGVMSPAPPMSPALFSPCPSPAIYVPQNAYSPLPSPALSPNPFWHPQNQQSTSFNNVRCSPSPTTPLTIQIPTFSSPPPVVTFSAANNCSMPPPPYFSTPPPYQYSSRF